MGAVDLLCMRVAALRTVEERTLGGGQVGRSRRDVSVAWPLCWLKRRRDDAAHVCVAASTAAASVLSAEATGRPQATKVEGSSE